MRACGYWLVLHSYRALPGFAGSRTYRRRGGRAFDGGERAGERAYLELLHNLGFERPYGWACCSR